MAGRTITDADLNQLLVIKTVSIGAVFIALFAAERIWRAGPPPAGNARLWRNGGLWLLVLLAAPLIVAPITAFGANHLLWVRPELTGGARLAALAIDIALLDLWTYWLHRLYHEVPFLWRFHEVHHRDEWLDTTSAVRFHLGEVVISATLRILPITLLAVPLWTVIIFETLLLTSALFHHSNVRLPEKVESALSRVIVTPSIHWVHHHAKRVDTDSNYAGIFSMWDRLFASRSKTERALDMKIGVEGVTDASFARLLVSPFSGRRK